MKKAVKKIRTSLLVLLRTVKLVGVIIRFNWKAETLRMKPRVQEATMIDTSIELRDELAFATTYCSPCNASNKIQGF